MKKVIFLGLTLLSLTLSSCASKKTVQTELPHIGDSTQNSVDWNGVYLGEMTTESGDYIEIQLTLHEGGKYSYINTPTAKSNRNTYAEGTFKWVFDGKAIELDKPLPNCNVKLVHVGENTIFLIKGTTLPNPVKWDELTQLSKTEIDTNVTEKYWKLVQLNDHKVTEKDIVSKEPSLILKNEFNGVNGNDGCNIMNGQFTIKDGMISFGKLMSTMMACEGAYVYQHFGAALSEPLKYEVTENTLVLKSKNYELKFEVVYLR